MGRGRATLLQVLRVNLLVLLYDLRKTRCLWVLQLSLLLRDWADSLGLQVLVRLRLRLRSKKLLLVVHALLWAI